ncbi:hypothetical protein ACFJGW_19750 [Burkholderiaceae bacterium UC74_6]
MLHPFYRTLASEPQLLLEHASAYMQLAGAETGEALQQWRLRVLVGAVVLLGLCLSLALAGGALLLLSAHPWETLAQPWLLVVTPLLPLLPAVVGLIWLRAASTPPPFQLLREQWALDLQLLNQVEPK